MKHFEGECGEACAEQVREPIENVIAAAAGGESLVPFIQPPDGGKNEHDRGDDFFPSRALRVQAEQGGSEQAAAAEKIAEMLEFIDVMDGGGRASANGK